LHNSTKDLVLKDLIPKTLYPQQYSSQKNSGGNVLDKLSTTGIAGVLPKYTFSQNKHGLFALPK